MENFFEAIPVRCYFSQPWRIGLQFGLTQVIHAAMTPERYHKIRQTLERRQADLTLIADQVQKGRNLAAMRRTCDAFAVGEIHAAIAAGLPQRRYAGINAGTHKRVRLVRHESIDEAVQAVRSRGMKIVVADMNERAVDYQTYDFTQPLAILMGSEEQGVSERARELADDFVHIPMFGLVESLNVSVAFALILAEACRQREAKGMFERAHLSEQEIDRLTFEWGYPRLKNYYLGKGLAYPKLDEQGQIVDS